MAPAPALTAGTGAAWPAQPSPTKASCSVTWFIARVQIKRESGALVVRASRGFDDKALQYFQRIMPGPSGGAAGNAFAQQRRWVIEDVDQDPGFEPFRNGAHDAGFRFCNERVRGWAEIVDDPVDWLLFGIEFFGEAGD